MIYSAIDVANWFINRYDKESGDVITNLKVQKLVYYSEAWCQLILNRELFSEDILFGEHGPVVVDVFDQFHGVSWIPLYVTRSLVEFDTEVENILLKVLDAYGMISSRTMEKTIKESDHWEVGVIDKKSIKVRFTEKYHSILDDNRYKI